MEKVPGHGLCPDLSGPGRPARSSIIPDPIPNFDLSPLLIWKSLIGRFSNEKRRRWGAILMKMAVFFIENAFCVGLFQSFYDGGDLDENGCFLY